MRLELKDAACGYGKKAVLEHVSLSVESGELVCLLGPNGVGKTTLFKSIMGFLKLMGGSIELDGRNRAAIPQREFSKIVGYVPQSHEPPFPFSVMDVVVMGRTAHLKGFSSPTHEDFVIAENMLERLGATYLRDEVYTNISGGERQMVLIARALTQTPDLLVMDEPTANLDYGNQVKVLRTIRQLSDSGIGVLMTSHNPDHAFLCCTRAVLIDREGRVRSGAVDEVVTEQSLRDAYGVNVRIAESSDDAGGTVRTCVPMLAERTGS